MVRPRTGRPRANGRRGKPSPPWIPPLSRLRGEGKAGRQTQPSAALRTPRRTALALSRPGLRSRGRHVSPARAPGASAGLPAPSAANARARPTWGRRRRLGHPLPALARSEGLRPRARLSLRAPLPPLRRPRHAPRGSRLPLAWGGPLREAPPAWPPSAAALAPAPSAAGSSTAAPRRFQVGPRLPLLHFPQQRRLLPVPSFLGSETLGAGRSARHLLVAAAAAAIPTRPAGGREDSPAQPAACCDPLYLPGEAPRPRPDLAWPRGAFRRTPRTAAPAAARSVRRRPPLQPLLTSLPRAGLFPSSTATRRQSHQSTPSPPLLFSVPLNSTTRQE